MSTDHYENFPVASILCPPDLRPAVLAIYRFARVADDLADEGLAPAQERLRALDLYRAELGRAARGEPARHWPEVFEPLGQQIGRHALPVHLLADLIDAFAQDCACPEYRHRSELLDYCRRSANPVGRLMLHLYRIDDPLAQRQSDAVCTALQLINFWQDASIDLPRGRCYFPAEDLRRHRLTAAELALGDSAGTQALIAELVAWTRGLMHSGCALARRVPGRAGWELRLVVQGGMRILERIEALEFRTLRVRPVLSRADWPRMLWRALRMSAADAIETKAAA